MFDKSSMKRQMVSIWTKGLSFFLSVSISMSGCIFLQKEKTAAAAKRIVVTIDPGHGGSEKGAYVKYKGRLVCEKNLNLKIARYMKKELESYKNVTVYLTRSDDRNVTLEGRVQIAKNHGSNLLFSIHNNAGGPSSSYRDGACALISSGQYHKELSTVAATIGKVALERISSSVGMVNRGYLKRLSASQKYPNGKTADYYAIVRGGTTAGFASMIIEHGFVDNKKDLKKLVKSSVQKKLGVADARAVANYYGLAKKNGRIRFKRLGSDIKMVTRHWMLKDGRYYFVTKKEKLLTGWKSIGGWRHHFEANGAATKGFHKIGSEYYSFDDHGKVFRGWKKIKKKWYFFRKNGKALRNCTTVIRGKKYRFAKNGKCLNP
ncbi:MAG: N-acetylmuramoyl-L-alanine amidase [Lachnospiraceae bacterium]|nr:N-acetylmuramoyl-L-alanine amidase [Lachnospiraceae bacterium]